MGAAAGVPREKFETYSSDQVADVLASLGNFEKYRPNVLNAGVDGKTVAEVLNDEALAKCGIKSKLDRKVVLMNAEQLQKVLTSPAAVDTLNETPEEAYAREEERAAKERAAAIAKKQAELLTELMESEPPYQDLVEIEHKDPDTWIRATVLSVKGDALTVRFAPNTPKQHSEETVAKGRVRVARCEICNDKLLRCVQHTLPEYGLFTECIRKIGTNLHSVRAQGPGHKAAVIVQTGVYNPIHVLHTKAFYIARQFIEHEHGLKVVGGIVYPTHDSNARSKVRGTRTALYGPALYGWQHTP
jgi:hypothetical protein